MYEKVTFYDYGAYKGTQKLNKVTEHELHIIEMYLKGNLSSAETADINSRMKADKEFRTQVELIRASIIGIRQAVLDEKLELIKEEEKKMAVANDSDFRITPLYKWVAVAASLILCMFLLQPLLKEDNSIHHQYLAEHFEEFVLHDTYKGELDDAAYLEMTRGYNLFAEKEFDQAVPILKHSWETHQDSMSLFYLWITAFATEDTALKSQYERDIQGLSSNNKYRDQLKLIMENSERN